MAVTIEQLLATLAIDRAEALAVTDRYVIIMRDPQVDETGVPVDSTIRLRIVDLSGDPANPDATIDATIGVDQGAGEVTAWDGAAFQAPWNAALSAEVKSTVADPYCFKDYTIDQDPSLFGSEQVVTVHVGLTTVVGGFGYAAWGHFPWGHIAPSVGGVDVYYEFTAADVEAPNVISAEALDQYTVRVTFDDDMATSGAGSALDDAVWSFTRLNEDPAPAVTLDAVSVAQVSSTVFDITTNWEMTPTQTYQVSVAGTVTDTSGNAVATASATFPGFAPEHPRGRVWDYWRMLPVKNRIEDATHDLERFALVIDEVLQLLTVQVDHWTDQFDPDLASDEAIDLLLYDLGNPFEWADLDLTAQERRKLLRVLVDIYRQKGTAEGIEDTIFFLLGEVVEVVEYLAGGWELGIDELGEGSVAQIFSDNAETYNFAALPADLDLLIDGAAVTVTFQAGDFANPAAATAAEVVAALDARLPVGGAYEDVLGTPAQVVSSVPGMPGWYPFSGGETLDVEINGTPFTVTFRAIDSATAGQATIAEVVARINLVLAGYAVAEPIADGFTLETALAGAGETIEVTGGTANVFFGIAGGVATGTDDPRVAIYSPTVGVDATISATGGAAMTVLGFSDDPASGTGGAILAPSTEYALYSFDLETATALDSETEAIVRRIAEYMKPAHTHLVNIREALPLPWPEGWEIGVDELGETTELTA